MRPVTVWYVSSAFPDPAKGDYTVIEGQFVPDAAWYIPRADVGDFMLASLNTHDWDRKCVAIGRKN
ncbi:hypothetical protein OS493_023021 [Desmophyllum pertusum]|uniref:Uncharacterized protein n=1 Tax=Desmophyllum pertusum TaxID=174260 RepID=A0A9W9ZBM3_9CNID|nr:hypothetical protein OS493_023021 [Desmophyllum pertusum]